MADILSWRIRWLRQAGLIVLVAFGVLSNLASEGGGDPVLDFVGEVLGTPPSISNFRMSRNTFEFMEDGGRVTVDTTMNYSDPESDIESIRIQINNGVIDVYPVGVLPASSGTIAGVMHIPTDLGGEFTAEVWAVDEMGHSSSRLTVAFTVLVASGLPALSWDEGNWDEASWQ